MDELKIVVACPTKEIYAKVIAKMTVFNTLKESEWDAYEEKTVIYVHQGSFCYAQYARDRGYTVIKPEFYLQEEIQEVSKTTIKLKKGSLYTSKLFPYLVVYIALNETDLVVIRNARKDVPEGYKTKVGAMVTYNDNFIFEITDMEVSLKLKGNE